MLLLSRISPPPCQEIEKAIFFLTLPQRQTDFSSEVRRAYLLADSQKLIHLPKFSLIFARKESRAHIYAILVRSVLYIYAVGLYNYTFYPFSVTSPSARVHTLYCPSAQPIAECLKKLRRPCAHGWQHVCTRPPVFCLPAFGHCIYIQKSSFLQGLENCREDNSTNARFITFVCGEFYILPSLPLKLGWTGKIMFFNTFP